MFFGYLSSGVDLGFVDGRALFLDKLIPLLSKVPEGSYKVLPIDMAAKRAGLTVDQIEKQLSVDLSTDNEKIYSQNTIKSASNYLEQAISILLHYPELANKTDLTWLDDKGESLKGAGRLLVKIIYFLQEQYTLKAKLKATQNSDYPFEIRIDKILMHFSS